MRILLDWKKPEPDIERLVSELQREHKVVYHIGFSGDDARNVSKATFHDVGLAVRAEPAKTHRSARFDPPSAELIEKMYPFESIILTMMNRKFGSMGVDERKHVYYQMLAYWSWVLNEYRPQMILFNAIPHATYNYVIFGLAKVMGIETKMFVDSWTPDRMLSITDYKVLDKTLCDAVESNKNSSYKEDVLSEPLRSYFRLHSESTNNATPGYLIKQKSRSPVTKIISSKIKGLFSSLGNGLFFVVLKRNIGDLFIRRPKKIAEKEYRTLAQKPDFSTPFVYFALHYQPERTTSPQGEVFVDQILVAETLAKSLPVGWKLYIKEHPLQWFFRDSRDPHRFTSVRYPSYYRRLAALPNTVLISPEVSSYLLMKHSKAVATVTGKVGIEGLIREKPVLVFGYPWYRFCSEVMIVGGVDDCRAAFSKIISGWKPSRQAFLNFMKIADDLSFYGYTDKFGGDNSTINPKENILQVSDWILNELREFNK